jgi:5'/3'-nucleotidase SurE
VHTLILACALAAAAAAQTKPLRILLTNDDGYDSAGITVMREALASAGHQVIIVAPATNMSSTGMSMTSGAIKVEPKGENVWAVHGTPADAATIGMVRILRDAPPDLVVSGTNAGQNLGTSANSSGTINAAIAASRFGVPAIATSAGLGAEASHAYAVAAALVNQMIVSLVKSAAAGGRLLPDRMVINMNVPALPPAELKGVRWTPLSTHSSYRRVYSETGTPNELRAQLIAADAVEGETGTDLALFRQGYVTLTLLDGDVGVDASATAPIQSRLSLLALPPPAAIR